MSADRVAPADPSGLGRGRRSDHAERRPRESPHRHRHLSGHVEAEPAVVLDQAQSVVSRYSTRLSASAVAHTAPSSFRPAPGRAASAAKLCTYHPPAGLASLRRRSASRQRHHAGSAGTTSAAHSAAAGTASGHHSASPTPTTMTMTTTTAATAAMRRTLSRARGGVRQSTADPSEPATPSPPASSIHEPSRHMAVRSPGVDQHARWRSPSAQRAATSPLSRHAPSSLTDPPPSEWPSLPAHLADGNPRSQRECAGAEPRCAWAAHSPT